MLSPAEYVNKIIWADCLDALRLLPDACVDAVVTDPPYGLGTHEPTSEEIDAYVAGARLDTGGDFMSRKWDIPSVAVWREVNRVLKPGGYALSFAGSRTWDLMHLGMETAGLTDKDTFMSKFNIPTCAWMYGQGFPKSHNVSKTIRKTYPNDPAMEAIAKKFEGYGTALKPSWEPILVFRREGAILVQSELDAPFFYCAKANKSEANLEGAIDNTHPTKKPISLMSWLINLATPTGGLVLDPFCGSGSTCHAAIQTGRQFIGIERDPEFHTIATKRVEIVMQRQAAPERDFFEEMMGGA